MKDIVIGIDIGGSITKYGFTDSEGNIFSEGSTPTTEFDEADDFFNHLNSILKEAEQSLPFPKRLIGIGVGAPNANYHTACVEHATNLKWKGIVNISRQLQKSFDVPVKVTNDANAAALGEMIYGGAKQMTDFLLITLGTGLGSGLVTGGKLIYGKHGFAGELGHINAVRDGRLCGCGKNGCLETYVSAPGICKTVLELLNERDSVLDKSKLEQSGSREIFNAALKNDAVALEAFEITGKMLGEKLADTAALLDPEAIFLLGGLANAGELLFNPVKKHMELNLMPAFRNRIKILPSGLKGKNAAVLGASALIHEN